MRKWEDENVGRGECGKGRYEDEKVRK